MIVKQVLLVSIIGRLNGGGEGGFRANLVIGWAEVRRRRDDLLSQVKFGQGEEQWYVFAFYFLVNLGFNLGSYTVENLLYH